MDAELTPGELVAAQNELGSAVVDGVIADSKAKEAHALRAHRKNPMVMQLQNLLQYANDYGELLSSPDAAYVIDKLGMVREHIIQCVEK